MLKFCMYKFRGYFCEDPNNTIWKRKKGNHMSKRKKINNIASIRKSIFLCMGVLFLFCFFRKVTIYAETVTEWKFEVYMAEGIEYADLTEYLDKERSQIIIPKYVQDEKGNSYPVGRVTSIATEKESKINRIQISEDIENIVLQKRCFTFCESLKEVDIACKVQMKEGAFCGCKNLETLRCRKGLHAYGISMETFAGCEKLTDVIVSEGEIQTEGGVFDSIPREFSLILEDTLELQVKDDFSRGNVNFVCYKNLSAKKDTNLLVKNGYFYDTNAKIEHLKILSKGKLYAITTSPVFRENTEVFTDVVAGIEVDKVRNTAFFVPGGMERKITVKDLKLVTAGKDHAIKVNCYAPGGRKTIFVEQWQDSEEEADYSKGAILVCSPLKAGDVQCPVIAYSGKRCILGEIQGHNSLPSSIDIQLAEDAHLVEGMTEDMVSGQLLVTVLFENGTYQEILSKEDYHVIIEGNGYLKQGRENNLLVVVNKDYEITGRLSKVEAAKKQITSGSVIYMGSTERGIGTALEGTKPNVEDFSVFAAYDNGETVYLQSSSITVLFEEVMLGEQVYDILCEGCKMSVKITGVPDRIQSIKAKYLNEWIPVGEHLDTKKIQFELIRESGKTEEVQTYMLEEYLIKEGENSILLTYTGNLSFVPRCGKTVKLAVFGVKKEEITTEVFLKKEDLDFMPGSVADISLFGIKQVYQGKSVIIENPDIFILPYELTSGENILQVQYQGNLYPVSVWVGENFPQNTQKPDSAVSVKPTPKPEFNGEIFIAGTGKIKFQGNGKISYRVYEKEPVTIAFSTKKIKKIQWQLVLKGKRYKKTAWKTLNGNIWNYYKNITNCVLYIQATDENGNTKIKRTNGFTIDRKKPTLNLVNKKTYAKEICVKAADKESGIKKITLNGKKISNGEKVTKKGKYQIHVWDKAGNCTKRVFFIG